MSGHTKGPWSVTLKPGYVDVVSDDDLVCEVTSSLSHEDARLIAAAPMLLEALRECARLLDTLPWTNPDANAKEIMSTMMGAAQAIRAAEGSHE